ncbi:hypothetical protein POSPLADRAFT_1145931, partial [Postia placenta MAD-698-R-SB12]
AKRTVKFSALVNLDRQSITAVAAIGPSKRNQHGINGTKWSSGNKATGVSAFSSVDGKRAVVVDIVKVLCVSGAIERKCVIVFCGDGGFKVPRDNDFVHTPGIIFIFTTGYLHCTSSPMYHLQHINVTTEILCFGPSSLNHIRLNRHVAYTLTYETYETRWLADDAVGKGTSPSSSSSLSGKSASSSPSGRKREADKKCGSNVGRFRLIVHHDVRGREEDDGTLVSVRLSKAGQKSQYRSDFGVVGLLLVNQSDLQGEFTAHVANLEVDPGMLHAEMSTRTVGIAKWRAADESCAKSRGLDMQNDPPPPPVETEETPTLSDVAASPDSPVPPIDAVNVQDWLQAVDCSEDQDGALCPHEDAVSEHFDAAITTEDDRIPTLNSDTDTEYPDSVDSDSDAEFLVLNPDSDADTDAIVEAVLGPFRAKVDDIDVVPLVSYSFDLAEGGECADPRGFIEEAEAMAELIRKARDGTLGDPRAATPDGILPLAQDLPDGPSTEPTNPNSDRVTINHLSDIQETEVGRSVDTPLEASSEAQSKTALLEAQSF